jgi:hypothetical protein
VLLLLEGVVDLLYTVPLPWVDVLLPWVLVFVLRVLLYEGLELTLGLL